MTKFFVSIFAIFAIIFGMNVSNTPEDNGVIVNPGNGHGGVITAYHGHNTYELWEDCSVSISQNGHVVGGTYLQDMSDSYEVKEPLKDTAKDFMPWCVSNN